MMMLILLDAAAKSFVLMLLATAVCLGLRRASAATRHLVWVASLCAILAMPAFSLLLPSARVLPGWLSMIQPARVMPVVESDKTDLSIGVPSRRMPRLPSTTIRLDSPNEELVESTSQSASPPQSIAPSNVPVAKTASVALSPSKFSWDITSILLLVWVCGAALLLLPLVVGTWASRRLARWLPALTDGDVLLATTAISRELRIAPPSVHLGSSGAMPMVWGVLRGHLLLPDEAATCDGFPLRAVLLHELAHLRRRDPLTMVIGQLARAVYWFNPLVWLAVHRMRIERERACDDEVLRSGVKPSDYASSLLEIATSLRPCSATAISLAMADARRIEGRVRTILDADQNRRAVSKWSAAVTVMLAAVVSVALSMVRAADEKLESAPPKGAKSETFNVTPTAVEPTPVSQTPATVPQQKVDAAEAELTDEEQNAKAEALLARLNDVSKTKFNDLKPDELAGLVVDVDFNPLAGVLVDIWTFQAGTETTTDENGLFRLKIGDEETRKVEVRFSKPGYSPDYRLEQSPGEVMLVGLDNKTYIEGRLRGLDGTPVANATIKGIQKEQQIEPGVIPGPTTLATTDADGRYRMYVFRDTYDIRVNVAGVGVARVSDVEVHHEEARSLDINLQPAVRFEAKVVDAVSREPVEKFVLWNCFDSSVLGVSNAEGKIVIDGMLPGEFEFFCGQGEPLDQCNGTPCYGNGNLGRWWSADAVHEHEQMEIGKSGWQRNFDNLTFHLAIGMKPVTIETERGVTFSGHVDDPDGKPVEGATVAPALNGYSLTGDTRYSTKTERDGSYRVVMPAGNAVQYGLMVHDGDYREWRSWANGISEPISTKPGQKIENFDLKLSRPATVRGRLVVDEGLSIGDREITSEAADKRENNYYQPTTKVNDDGTFELKFVRPGKQIIHLGHMRPSQSSVEVELKEGEVLEGIELRAVSDFKAVTEQMKKRTFRVTVLNGDGQPAANQQLWLSAQHRMSLNLEAFSGDRAGFANRMKPFEKYADASRRTDAEGHVDIPGGWQLFDEYNTSATVIAVNGEKAEGAIGHLRADLKSPEITLRMAPLCEVRMPITTDDLPASDEHASVELLSKYRLVVRPKLVTDQLVVQLPVGEYEMTVSHPLGIPQEVKFSVKPGSEQLTLEPVRFKPSHLARLLGQPAPELRNIEAWLYGDAIQLAEQRGKIVVLAFWHRSYHGWDNSIPMLKTLRLAYPEKDVVIIGVFNNFWLQQIKKEGLWDGQELPFRVALADSSGSEVDGVKGRVIQGRAMSDYGVTHFPTTLLIDPQGRVVSLLKSDDFDDTKKQIDRLLGKRAANDLK
jgi:beta-lactamase regulating signal transducer with metallopeptidase domain